MLATEKKNRAEYNHLMRFFQKNPDYLGCIIFHRLTDGFRYFRKVNGVVEESKVNYKDYKGSVRKYLENL